MPRTKLYLTRRQLVKMMNGGVVQFQFQVHCDCPSCKVAMKVLSDVDMSQAKGVFNVSIKP